MFIILGVQWRSLFSIYKISDLVQELKVGTWIPAVAPKQLDLVSKYRLHEVLLSAGSSELLKVDSRTLKNYEALSYWYTLAASSKESDAVNGSCMW